MVVVFDDLRQDAVGRHAGKAHAALLEPALIGGVDLVAVAVTLGDFGLAVDLGHPAAAREHRRISAKPHGAAEIAAHRALLQFVPFQPLRHKADHRLRSRAELGRVGFLDAAQIARSLDNRHLHAEADTEIRNVALARKARRLDLAFGAALAEAARHQNAVDLFEERRRVFVLEYVGFDPVEIDLDLVGDAAVR